MCFDVGAKTGEAVTSFSQSKALSFKHAFFVVVVVALL